MTMTSCVIKARCDCLKQSGLNRTACCPLSLIAMSPTYAAQGRKRSFACSANYQTTSQSHAPAVPNEFEGVSKEAYLAGYKSGYAAGVQVTVSISLDSGKNLKAVEYSGGIQQDSLLRSLLKGVVWRVFSTALTVCIILGVFRDTVQMKLIVSEAFFSTPSKQ